MSLFGNLSITRKVVLIAMASCGVAVALACSAFVAVDMLLLKKVVGSNTMAVADMVAADCVTSVAFSDAKAAHEDLNMLLADPRIVAACIFQPDGTLFAGFNCGSPDMVLPAEMSWGKVLMTGRYMDVFRPVYLEGELIGVVRLRADIELTRERLRGYAGVLVGLIIAAFVTASLLSYSLQRQVSGPILGLLYKIRNVIERKDYSIREQRKNNDEIGQLVDGFNEMLTQIQSRDAELEKSRELLEGRVDERTRELKREIELHRRVDAALRDSEKKYRDLIETSADVIWRMDEAGRITFVNNAVRFVYGYQPRDVIGRLFSDFSDPAQVEADQHMLDSLRQGQAFFQYETLHLRNDGVSVHLSVNAIPLHDEAGRVVGATGSSRDITEQKLAEGREKDLQERLARAERIESVGVLAGGVAHDLNNILGPMVGYPDLLLEELERDSPLRGDLEQIRDSAKRAAVIIQDLLTLARRGHLQPVPVRANEVVQSFLHSPGVRDLVRRNAGVDIALDLAPDVPPMMASVPHLHQALMNLLLNACESMSGGGTLTIGTSHVQLAEKFQGYESIERGSYVVLRVADTGQPIPKEDADRIFEPFYTKKKMGRSGSGLGLAVVYGVVHDLGGFIDLQRGEERGTTFILYFPVADRRTQPGEEPCTSCGGSESILVVDDVEEQRKLASRLLGTFGYRVDLAANGLEAVEKMKQQAYDLVLLDMIMENHWDGLDTYREMIKVRTGQKCLIVSGFSESDRVRETLALGAGGYVRKPYTRDKLARAVRAELDR